MTAPRSELPRVDGVAESPLFELSDVVVEFPEPPDELSRAAARERAVRWGGLHDLATRAWAALPFGRNRRGGTAGADKTRRVLDGVNLTIPASGFTHIVGASGSGKTTLLRLLNRLTDPTAGEIRFRGRPLVSFPPVEHRREVAYVPQSARMLPGTVRENLEQPLLFARDPDIAGEIQRGARVLYELGLDGAFLEREAANLSAGERHRVALVRSLMTSPRVLLLDEATSQLDDESADAVLALLTRLHEEEGMAVVFVSHRKDHILRLGGHVFLLAQGCIRDSGPVARLEAPKERDLLQHFFES